MCANARMGYTACLPRHYKPIPTRCVPKEFYPNHGAKRACALRKRTISRMNRSKKKPVSVPITPCSPVENRLLAALPEAELQPLLPHLELVSLTLGQVIYESGGQMSHVYFPTDSIISLLYLMENGATAEIGMTGFEGMVGIALFMGGQTTPNRAVVQRAGNAYRMTAKALQDEFVKGGTFQQLLLRFTQALITQISQTAVCNRLHSIEQQLCRWLLLSYDRLHSNKLAMTHNLIANLLGVRREGVTLAAKQLQERGVISYVRGIILLLDRPKLEATACECYQVVKTEYDRLLG